MTEVSTASSQVGHRPMVAVITRTKDRSLLLERCIQSVLAQDFFDWIHVIANDGGSSEEVNRLASKYAAAYKSRIVVLHHQQSKGMEAASNASLRGSQSKLIAFLDDDDTWDPYFLSTMVDALSNAGTSVRGVVCQSEIVSERTTNGNIEVVGTHALNSHLKFLTLEELIIGNQFTNNAFLFYKSVLEDVGYFDERLPVLGDWDFNIRFLLRHDILVLPRILARCHWRIQWDSPNDVNSTHVESSPHVVWRSHLINRAIRGQWLEGGHMALILTMGTRIQGLERTMQSMAQRLDDLANGLNERIDSARQEINHLKHESVASSERINTLIRDYSFLWQLRRSGVKMVKGISRLFRWQ